MHIRLEKKVFAGQDLLKNATDSMIQPAWNKLYRRAVFAQLRYPEGKLNEDLFLIPEVCLQIQKGRGGAKGAVLLCAARRQHYERQ